MGHRPPPKKPTMPRLRVFVAAVVVAVGVLLLCLTLTSNKRRARVFSDYLSCNECRRLPAATMDAVVHYAASNVTPQQTAEEIALTLAVLKRKSPCNMLVFGLGYDSLMWATLNYGGRTVFLEEDYDWMEKVRDKHPQIVAHHVEYPTTVDRAFDLLGGAREAAECAPPAARDLQRSACQLAIKSLPDDVYGTEWDVVMIDAPRGYFPEAPGRMQAIFTAGVMALFRTRGEWNGTDVFIHDVDRSVEDAYANAFLCPRNRVAAAGRLWHFNIPANPSASSFCEASPGESP